MDYNTIKLTWSAVFFTDRKVLTITEIQNLVYALQQWTVKTTTQAWYTEVWDPDIIEQIVHATRLQGTEGPIITYYIQIKGEGAILENWGEESLYDGLKPYYTENLRMEALKSDGVVYHSSGPFEEIYDKIRKGASWTQLM